MASWSSRATSGKPREIARSPAASGTSCTSSGKSAQWTMRAMARIVHCADFPDEVQDVPEAAGLRAISRGFPLVARDDHEALAKASFLYDALYAALQERTR